VFNLARSEIKTHLGYREIADSCLRRVRELMAGDKVIGRPVLVLGHGTLGSRLATTLRAQGCQVHVVDPDPLALIDAAENGLATHRTVAEALRLIAPFLIVGSSGVEALSPADLDLLPDQTYLVPFATKDFSVLAKSEYLRCMTEIPGIGRRYQLAAGRSVVMLGDGRSANLFDADMIPNQGYDAYRAGTLVAAGALCSSAEQVPPGVHTSLVDDIIRRSGLYDAYYDTYLATGPSQPGRRRAATPTAGIGLQACVVGYGVAGRLHAEILSTCGAALTILDPKHQDLPRAYRSFRRSVAELPDTVASGTALWSICCPTADHLPVLQSIFTRDPQARVLLEKPACQSHEIDTLAGLLASHRNARILIADQYQHSVVLPTLNELIARHESDEAIDQITVSFSKDRTNDITGGRFIDRSYGVLGYEWLHMLAVVRQLLPSESFTAYLATDPQRAELTATYDPSLFVSALAERTDVTVKNRSVRIELASSITGPAVVLGTTPRAGGGSGGQWRRDRRPSDDRYRHIAIRAGQTRFTAHLAPVTAAGGWQLDRNQHRITVERCGRMLHDEVIDDSPMHTAIRQAVSALLGDEPLPPPDLAPLRRIARVAEFLRAQQPTYERVTADRR
jgi:hypothetical protein